MIHPESLVAILNVNSEEMSVKSAKFSHLLITSSKDGHYDMKVVSDYVKETFSYDELVFLSTVYLHKQTEDIMSRQNNQSIL